MANQKDKGSTAPDTTAFKNIKPGDIPKDNYSYKGDNVGNNGALPKDAYTYKGDNVGKSGALPKDNYTYKGAKVGKKGKK